MTTEIAKQYDVGYVFADDLTILDEAGAVVPLTDCTVWFVVARYNELPIIAAVAAIVNATTQTVRYLTVDGDFDTAGIYRQVWLAEFDDGRRYTSPSSGYNTIWVQPNPAAGTPDS